MCGKKRTSEGRSSVTVGHGVLQSQFFGVNFPTAIILFVCSLCILIVFEFTSKLGNLL